MTVFNEAYYRRFYEARSSRVQGRREVARLATVAATIVEATHGPIRTALEIGAGTGLWRDWFASHRPGVRYRSTDVSPYACERYAHELRDISQWKARQRFDLVICQGVLPYLSSSAAGRAIRNLAAMTGAYLYLEAVTSHDLELVADASVTDDAMKRRSGVWYRKRLSPHFSQVGFGLWVRRGAAVRLWELECAPDGKPAR